MTDAPVVTCATDVQGIAQITINRPDALNALNAEVLGAIHETVDALEGKAKAIIVTGAGNKAFVAGADIAEMADFDAEAAAAFSRRGQAAFQALSDFPGPVVAAINGYALGGGLELALACDILIASEKAVLGLPEATLAVVPGFGGSQRLPRRVGPGLAKLLLMTGDQVKSDEARKLRLVDRVVPPDELLSEARSLVQKMLRNGPLAIQAAKRLVDEGIDKTLASGLEMEADAFGQMFGTADQGEGMHAFLEKRKPQFTGQ